MSAVGSAVFSVRQLDAPPAARDDDEKEATPWSLEDNETQKFKVREKWCKDFKTNIDRFTEAFATSIFNDFTRALRLRTGEGLGTDPTSKQTLRQVYPLSLQSNAKAMKEWAGETARLSPMEDLFREYIPKEKRNRDEVEEGEYSSASSKANRLPIDHSFVEGMIAVLGKKVERLVQQKFTEWKTIEKNKNLETDAKWDPTKTNSMGLSSYSKGYTWPSIQVSAWLKDDYVKALEERNKGLLEGLTQADGELQPPPQNRSIFSAFKRS